MISNVCQLQCDTRLNRCPNRTPHVPGLVDNMLCQPSMAEAAQSCPLPTPKPVLPAMSSDVSGLAPVPAGSIRGAPVGAAAQPRGRPMASAPLATRTMEKFSPDDDSLFYGEEGFEEESFAL